MKITRSMIKENVAFHCNTEEKANELLGKLDSLGYKWGNETSYLDKNYYDICKEYICYYPYGNAYGDIGFYKNNNYDIIEYELDDETDYNLLLYKENKLKNLINKIEEYDKKYAYNLIYLLNEDEKREEMDKNMELNDTVKMMNSDNYKDRFKAEYIQTKIRYDKLDEMTVKYEAGTLTFKPSCSLELLKEQKKYMGMYIRCLKIRAEIEHVDLS